MDNLAQSQNQSKASLFRKIGEWWKAHFIEIAILAIIFLIILGIFGLWRLWKIIPKKEPIKIEKF